MSSPTSVTHSVDAAGIGWIVFDDPAARANVFNPATLAALRASFAAVLGTPGLKAVVVRSAKERIFLAGADLNWLGGLTDAGTATQAAREGQGIFGLIAGATVPVVAAIHGACAGGGFELALACSWRIATSAGETRLGLPEVGLGLIPGWGGCTRLPRLVGAGPALELIMKAALVPAEMARAKGLVDEVVAPEELIEHARATALRLSLGGVPARPTPPAPSPDLFATWREQLPVRWPHQPARSAVIEVIEQGETLPEAATLELESSLFGAVASGAVAKNLLRVFRLKERARKSALEGWFPEVTPQPSFRTVGIVGSGVMGSGIAHWCALHGFGVILCDSRREAIEHGVAVIRELFADGVRRGIVSSADAHRMTGGIGITTSLEDFEYCDLVIETVVEDLAIKRKVFAELSSLTKPTCVLATNSSLFPIDELAFGVATPGRVIGLHFFNLVSRMKLVEIGLGSVTSAETASRALGFVRELGKTAVVSRSDAGHLVPRIMFGYFNEACRLWEQGLDTALIDGAMTDWGWPMGPLRLIDEIGLDTTNAVFEGLENYYPERFARSGLCEVLLSAGLRGRKNGTSTGFYDYADGDGRPNPFLNQLSRTAAPDAARWTAGAIQAHLNAVLSDEAHRAVADGVVKSADDVDLALLLGAGFPAFRGGLLRPAVAI